tara:strand:- start:118 stop:462 length:345 start_codon:yes stop_codon:yes gene_type:complete
MPMKNPDTDMFTHLIRAKETIGRLEKLLQVLAVTEEEYKTVRKQIDCLWRVYFVADAACTGGKLMSHTGMAATQATYDMAYTAWKAMQEEKKDGDNSTLVCDNSNEIPELSETS